METSLVSYKVQHLGMGFAKCANLYFFCLHQGSPHPRGTPYSQAALKVFQLFHASLLYKSARSEATLEITGSLTISPFIVIV